MTQSNTSGLPKAARLGLRPLTEDERRQLGRRFTKWLETAPGKRLAFLSRREYSSIIRRFLAKEGIKLTYEDVNAFINEVTDKASRGNICYPFKRFLQMLGEPFKWELVTIPKKQKAKRPGNRLSAEVLEDIANHMDKEWRLVACIQNVTGARASEVLALRGDDINVTPEGDVKLRIWDRKGSRERNIDVPSLAEELLSRKAEGFMFVSLKERMGEEAAIKAIRAAYFRYRKAVRAAAAACGYPSFTSHDFRRSLARDVYDTTHDVLATQRILGHSRIETTMRYIGDASVNIKDIMAKVRGRHGGVQEPQGAQSAD